MISAALLPGGAAFAQEQAASAEPAQAADHDVPPDIVVTGSHIRRPAADALVPVQVIDREELTRVGAAQFSDIVRTIPSNTGTTLYNEGGRLTGTAQFELRGLGFSSTLVLVNGRRAGVAPLSDKSGADFLDINQFPLGMVQRVDVLKDGSSAIYGSEAVAGVVNIITRKGFQGLELSGEFQDSSNESYAVNLAAGKRFDRGSINLYATYYKQTGNVRSDFPWLINRIGGGDTLGKSQLLSVNGYPGTFSLARVDAQGNASGVSGAPTSPDPNCTAAGGVFAISSTGVTDRTTCRYDFTDQVGVIPSIQRFQAFVEGSYEVTDKLQYSAEISGSINKNKTFKRPDSFANGLVSGSANVYVPANSPFNFFVADPTRANGIRYVDPSQWNAATDVAVPLVANIRPEGNTTSGQFRQNNSYFRIMNDLEWDIGSHWNVSLSHQYAFARYEEHDPVAYDAAALNSLVLQGLYNPFATSIVSPNLVSPKDHKSVAANSQAVIDQIFYTTNVRRQTQQHVVDLNAAGPLLHWAGGDVSLAVGAQYRNLTLRSTPDARAASGGSNRPTLEAPVFGRQTVGSGFAELIVPWGTRGELQMALRHDGYNGGAGGSTDPKVSARVKLIDGVALRGSWGTSFQAPTLTQTSTSIAREIINDPVVMTPSGLSCSSTSVGRGTVVTTQSGKLTPQNSKNLAFGADVEPARHLRLTADAWRYSYSDLIAAGQNGQTIVSGQCVNGVYVPDARVQRDGTGQLFGVTTAYVNVGKVVTDGIDLGVSYFIPTGSAGTFTLGGNATYVRRFDVTGSNGVVTDKSGSRNFTNNFAPIPKWRGSGSLTWEYGVHRVSIGGQYTAGYRNDQSNDAPISSFTTFDAQYSIRLEKWLVGTTSFTIGANNIFDREPPALIRYSASGQLITGTTSDIDRPGYDALGGADIRGRIVYARVTQSF